MNLNLYMSCTAVNDTCLEGDVRLVDGENQFEGRVEICLNRVWGSVCDDFWNSFDSIVVCRQLGYATNGIDMWQSQVEIKWYSVSNEVN